jgi:hypothetical protein
MSGRHGNRRAGREGRGRGSGESSASKPSCIKKTATKNKDEEDESAPDEVDESDPLSFSHDESAPDEDDESDPLSFAQMEGKCHCCETGHKSPDCRNKAKIPKEEWAINKSQQHVHQSRKDDDKSTSRSNDYEEEAEETVTGWSGLHCSFAQTANMRDMILLDSDSTDAVFCNPKHVSNTRDLDESLSISTNGGIPHEVATEV